jgi:hypothetical protein
VRRGIRSRAGRRGRWRFWGLALAVVLAGVVGAALVAVVTRGNSSVADSTAAAPAAAGGVFGHRCRQQDPADGGDHFGWQRSERGTGSGEIIRGKGYILTNNPVISVAANGGQVSVLFSDGHSAPATITAAIPGPTWESDDHRSCRGQLPQLGAPDLEQNGAWRTGGRGLGRRSSAAVRSRRDADVPRDSASQPPALPSIGRRHQVRGPRDQLNGPSAPPGSQQASGPGAPCRHGQRARTAFPAVGHAMFRPPDVSAQRSVTPSAMIATDQIG